MQIKQCSECRGCRGSVTRVQGWAVHCAIIQHSLTVPVTTTMDSPLSTTMSSTVRPVHRSQQLVRTTWPLRFEHSNTTLHRVKYGCFNNLNKPLPGRNFCLRHLRPGGFTPYLRCSYLQRHILYYRLRIIYELFVIIFSPKVWKSCILIIIKVWLFLGDFLLFLLDSPCQMSSTERAFWNIWFYDVTFSWYKHFWA